MKVGRVHVFSRVCPLLCVEFVTRSAVPVLFYMRTPVWCVRFLRCFSVCVLFRREHASPRELAGGWVSTSLCFAAPRARLEQPPATLLQPRQLRLLLAPPPPRGTFSFGTNPPVPTPSRPLAPSGGGRPVHVRQPRGEHHAAEGRRRGGQRERLHPRALHGARQDPSGEFI